MRKPNTNEPELLPCPFCGGEARYYGSDNHGTGNSGTWEIECCGCGNRTDLRKVRPEAKKLWNSRIAVPSAPQWTMEPPKEGGFYVMHWRVTSIYDARFLDDDQFMEGQCMDEKIKDTEQMLSTLYPGALWLKLDVPPLPEWKEKKK